LAKSSIGMIANCPFKEKTLGLLPSEDLAKSGYKPDIE